MVSTRWAWAAILAVLFAGLGNAHLHYCFDGQEPPVSVHLTDGIDPGHDHHDHSGHPDDHDPDLEQHDDIDVDLDLTDRALAKLLKLDQPAIASLGGWSIVIVAPPGGALAEYFEAPPQALPLHSLPPTRGPPV